MDKKVPPIKAAKQLRAIMTDYFHSLGRAAKDPGGRVAWCTSIGPCELLLAMGFQVYYPENHGALLGASRTASDLIPLAVARGYSPEICSYLTSDIGSYLKGFTPLTKAFGLNAPPRPDLLFFNNNQCREVQDWFMFYARQWGTPLLGVNSPRVLRQVKRPHLDDVIAQLEELIPSLEKISGNRFDLDKLRETVGLSKQCTVRWKKVLEYAAHRPAPMTFFDHCVHMAPAVVLRGTQQAVDYYDLLLEELAQRVADGVAAVPGEKHRFYWDGMPVWGRLRMLSDLMLKLGVAVVASTYCNSWIFEPLDAKRPFESMAAASLECFNVRDEDFKEGYMKQWMDLCQVDGMVFHDARTCPYNTNSRFGMPQRLSAKLGMPSLVIDGDLNDLRFFSDEQAKTNLEAFVEQFEE